MYRLLLTCLLLFSFAFAYVDEDLDGVDDAVDKCPGTPFDVLVGADGCPLKEKGNFYIKLSSSYSVDEGDSSFVSYITLSYSNQRWYFSITGSYILDSINNNSDIGDTYLFGSYIIQFNDLYAQIGLNLKLPTSETSKSIDISPSILLDWYIGSFDIFAYGNYIFTNEKGLKNSANASIGLGNQFSEKLYLSLSADYSQATVSGFDDEFYTSFYLIYDLTEDWFLSLLYSYGLNRAAVDHTIFGKIGLRF